MKKIKRKVFALLALVAVLFTNIADPVLCANAEEVLKQEDRFLHGYVNQDKEYTTNEYFHVEDDNTIIRIVISTTAEDAKGVLKFTYKSEGTEEKISNDIEFAVEQSEQKDTATGKTLNYCKMFRKLQAGDYNVSISFDKATTFDLYLVNCMSIIDDYAEVVEGFSSKMTVGKSEYANLELSSSNESVATIDNEGNIKGIKPGTAKVIITGKDADGNDLFTLPNECKIKVKKNVYKADKKLTISRAKKISGTIVLEVYKMNYDSKGNLKITLTVANKYKKAIKRVNNVKIQVKNGNGKTLGKYSGSLNLVVKSGKTKNKTVTIKKKNLKIKDKVDLTNLTYKKNNKGDIVYLNNKKDKLTATVK